MSNHSPSPYLKQEKKTSSLCPLPLNTADSAAEVHEESLSTASACFNMGSILGWPWLGITSKFQLCHQFCLFERTWILRRSIFKISFVLNFEAVIHILFGIFLTLYRPTEWIQLLARFLGWILSRFLIDVVLVLLPLLLKLFFCYLGSECLPALSTICLFGCLACV